MATGRPEQRETSDSRGVVESTIRNSDASRTNVQPHLHRKFHRAVVEPFGRQKIGSDDWMKWGSELQGSITAETASLYGSSTDPLAWANETLQVTRRLYKDLDSDDLRAAYYEANLPVVEEQLERAGVRLATMLNAMFAPPPTSQPATPPAVPTSSPTEF